MIVNERKIGFTSEMTGILLLKMTSGDEISDQWPLSTPGPENRSIVPGF